MTNTAYRETPSGGMARSVKLAALPLAFTGRAAAGWGRRLAGADADAVSAAAVACNAEQLFTVLGQLEGGAMKVGQVLSVYDALIPADIAEPYHRALSRLQSSGPSMPARVVRPALDEQLGSRWRRRFRDFDDVPAAAASVGQVHRAVWVDGRAVAVKIQYPGADLALDLDLRTLERFSRLFMLIVPGLEARAVMRELRERMLDELDYRAEADRQRAARLGLLHADPHPGNVLALTDGRLAMIDYGAIAALPGGIPPVLARILRHVADAEPDAMMDLLRAEGFVARDVAADDVLRYIGALGDPLRVERFHFHRAWMKRQGERVVNLRGQYRETGRALTLPAQYLLVVRVLSGWMNMLAQLDCTAAARGLEERWLPGFADGRGRYAEAAGTRAGRPAPADRSMVEAPRPGTAAGGIGRPSC
jgi:predicted unusual protein kinase regulating ubiquinone biosynthesis (AarF/ABC1/UbiB family)